MSTPPRDPYRSPIFDRLKASPPPPPPSPLRTHSQPASPAPKAPVEDEFIRYSEQTRMKLDAHLLDGQVLRALVITKVEKYAIVCVDEQGGRLCVTKTALAYLDPRAYDPFKHQPETGSHER